MKVRFECFDIIITTSHEEENGHFRYKSVCLVGGCLWNISHLQKVIEIYKERKLI